MRSLVTRVVGLVCVGCWLASSALAQVVYVDASAMGAESGASWTDAYTELRDALATTAAGEVWVAAGTYHPGAPGDRAATFPLVSGVAIYGGFAGGETDLAQRDVAANPTILSGDLDDDDTYGAGLNWWQFNWTGSGNNSYHVVTGSGADATAVLDGVTILAGVGSDPALGGGGGLLVLGGSPTFRDVTFRYNAIGYGSSGYLSDTASLFEDCVIRDGYTCNCGAGGWTSGLVITGASDVTFVDTDFVNHYYVSAQSQGRGAALNVDFDARATLTGCRFIGNQTGNFYPIGGGTAYGAGLNAFGDVVVDRCEFVDNFAHAGAGLTAWGDATVTNSVFARNEVVSHPETSELDVGDYGAGMLTWSNGTIEIANCTFVDNNGEKGAGLALYGVGPTTIRNTIVHGNFADPPLPGEDPVFILKQNLVGDFDIANSLVEGLLTTEPGEDPPDPANFPGCLDVDPQLADVAGGDYRLAPGSPAIDAGDNAAVVAGAVLDLAGAPRFVDDPATPDTGLGTAPLVDMGAFEFGATDDPWTDLGFALEGSVGAPSLAGEGTLLAGAPMTLTLTGAASSVLTSWVVGLSRLDAPFKGGVLVPSIDLLLAGLPTDVQGDLELGATWPAGIPATTSVYFQVWTPDAGGPAGFAASNALEGVTPGP